MIKIKNNIFLVFILFFILAALISAFIIEYELGHKPCKLCIYERIPYVLSVFLISEIIFYEKYEKITLLLLALIFFISAGLAFYHFGIEQGFFKESLICQNQDITDTLTKEQILEELKNSNVSCKEVNFRIFGISLATINTIFSLILSVIFLKLFLKYEKN